jgi:mannose-1-phosphate guanylyltransferase
MIYSVVMAGGSGTRFWPRSRETRPKQFLPILGKESLIRATLDRFRFIIGPEQTYIISKRSQEQEIRLLNADIPAENILFEPVGKDTAPCIGLAAIHIQRRDPDGLMVVTPSDHVVRNEELFQATILAAAELAEETRGMITIGIKPDRPATGYGYIQIEGDRGPIRGVETCRIKTFAEKPDLATAKSFLASGDYFWNSGIFVFRVSTYLDQLEELLPEIHEGLMEIQGRIGRPDYEETLRRIYQQIRGISIDFGVMEKAKDVFMVRGGFEWNDLGSWEQVYKLSAKDENKNACAGETLLLDTTGSYIHSENGLVAVLGLKDVVVVQEKDVTLICRMDRTEDLKKLVEKLRNKKLTQYL